MKIVGIIPGHSKNPDGFLIQIGTLELARLLGHEDVYGISKSWDVRLNVGDEIQVAKMFERLVDYKNIERKLETWSSEIKAAANILDSVLPGLKKANQKEENDGTNE